MTSLVADQYFPVASILG